MKELTREELCNTQLEILKNIHIFCQQNSINYSLCGGTLIGAVRHKGFIPWDDDIDIFMLREDYDKFIREYLETDSYVLYCFEKDKTFPYTFTKVCDKRTYVSEEMNYPYKNLGVNVDVFPIDNIPTNKINKVYFFQYVYTRLCSYKNVIPQDKIKKVLYYLINSILKPIPLRVLIRMLINFSKKYKSQNTEFCGNLVSGYGRKEMIKKSDFDSFVTLTFEGCEFNACIGYKNYLKSTFGDYMQLPPEDKQVTHHNFKAYWK